MTTERKALKVLQDIATQCLGLGLIKSYPEALAVNDSLYIIEKLVNEKENGNEPAGLNRSVDPQGHTEQ